MSDSKEKQNCKCKCCCSCFDNTKLSKLLKHIANFFDQKE